MNRVVLWPEMGRSANGDQNGVFAVHFEAGIRPTGGGKGRRAAAAAAAGVWVSAARCPRVIRPGSDGVGSNDPARSDLGQ